MKLKKRFGTTAALKRGPKKAGAAKKAPAKKTTRKSTTKKVASAPASKKPSTKKAATKKVAKPKSSAGRGRKARNVSLFGEKYFTKDSKVSTAGGGSKWTLKPRYRIYTFKLSEGSGTTKKRLVLVDKKPKESGKGKKTLRNMTGPGYTKNGKRVISVQTVTSTYKKRTKKVVRTATSTRKANVTRKKNQRMMGNAPTAPKAAKGKSATKSKGKSASKSKGKSASKKRSGP